MEEEKFRESVLKKVVQKCNTDNVSVHPKTEKKFDNVNYPKHYNSHPSGVECIEVTRHMSFNLGNAVKYLWRHKHKNGIEDLEKAIWYITDEIKLIKSQEQAKMETPMMGTPNLANIVGDIL